MWGVEWVQCVRVRSCVSVCLSSMASVHIQYLHLYQVLSSRSGKLFKGDQIVSINGRPLAGVSHSSAIKMLQKAKGQVELKLVRSSSSAGPPTDVQPINMAMDDRVCATLQ